MRTKRYFLFTALLLTLGGLLTACIVEEGEDRPRRTQGEYAVYSNLDRIHVDAVKSFRIAVGFDAYLRQTTDLGRAAVVARFFPWAGVIVREDSGWRLQDDELGNMYYYFMIKDNLLLGEPGASLLCYRRYSFEGDMRLVCDLATEEDGIRYKGHPDKNSWVDWSADVTLTERDFLVTLAGDSGFEYKYDWLDNESCKVDCRIGAPLQWSDPDDEISAGAMSVTAIFSGTVSRSIEFSVEHLKYGVNIISYDGVTEFWRWMD